MKNVIIIISFVALALGFSIWGYSALKSNTVSGKINVFNAVPKPPIALVHIHQIADFQSSLLYNNSYWTDLTKLEALSPFHDIITKMDSLKDISDDVHDFLKKRELLLSFFMENNQTEVLLSMNISKNDWKMLQKTILSDIFPNHKMQTISVNKERVSALTNANDTIYVAYQNNLFVSTKSPDLFIATLQQLSNKNNIFENDKTFNEVKSIAGKAVPANLFVNLKLLPTLSEKWVNTDAKRLMEFTKMYADWCGFDISFMEDRIMIAGFSSTQNTDTQIRLFNQQETGRNTLVEFMPQQTYFFSHNHISNLDLYRKNLAKIQSPETLDWADNQAKYFSTSTGENVALFFDRHFDKEIAFGYAPFSRTFNDNAFVIIKIKDETEAIARLLRMAYESNPAAIVSSAGNQTIVHWQNNGFAGSLFGNEYTLDNEYITIYRGHIFIASSRQMLQYLLNQKTRNRTLNRSAHYVQNTTNLFQQSNHTIFAYIPTIIRHVNSLFTPEKSVWINSTRSLWSNFETLIMQAENKRQDLQFQQLYVQYNKKTEIDILQEQRSQLLAENYSSSEEPETETTSTTADILSTETAQTSSESTTSTSIKAVKTWELALQKPITTAPQMVVNHNTGLHEIVVQDTDNFLYLISSEGKTIWRIPIAGRIISDIFQIDMYRNKRLQLVFNTADKLYVIDRTGRNLNRFPIDFPSKATAGVAIFDYNNNSDYRLFIPLNNKKIALYKTDGTQPSDWRFKQSNAPINKPIQHFRTNGMDFLVASNPLRSYFLHRRGNERLTPSTPVIVSKNNTFSNIKSGGKEKFVTTDKLGTILLINTNNEVNKVPLQRWTENHAFNTYIHDKNPWFIFLDNKRFEIFNEEYTSILRYNDIYTKSPSFTIWNNLLATYNEKSKELLIVNLPKLAVMETGIKTDKNLFYIGNLKPYKKTCVVVSEKNKLIHYLID